MSNDSGSPASDAGVSTEQTTPKRRTFRANDLESLHTLGAQRFGQRWHLTNRHVVRIAVNHRVDKTKLAALLSDLAFEICEREDDAVRSLSEENARLTAENTTLRDTMRGCRNCERARQLNESYRQTLDLIDKHKAQAALASRPASPAPGETAT